MKIYIRQGPEQELVLVAQQKDLDNFEYEVVNGELELSTRGFLWNQLGAEIEVYITVVNLRSIELSGAVKMESSNLLNPEQLEIELSGASELTLKIETKTLDLDMSGAAKATLEGTAESTDIDLEDASKLTADSLTIKQATLETSGASSATVHVEGMLSINAKDASHVTYSGDSQVDANVRFGAQVTKK